ncbi:hypothetical protein VHEMI05812 [[Torrubiella] hemipterigena]|uniref:Rhodanese domain-containing protein n=1 Tax=[Torrubiella] hemipterigena TaxID=1531966 RepID=A0A0A1T5A7_9HYPO|nr:hypothetical protein VHEMI05812 [[Torrubiella] hemipterigena]
MLSLLGLKLLRKMSNISMLPRLTAKELSDKILAEKEAADPTFAIVDVRDDDYIGGHIKGCIHAPSRQLDAIMPSLLRRLADKKTVIFHCALSQQRGPSAALRYIREKAAAADSETPDEQQVFVLDQGFTGWQQEFGTDERLTEGYRKELWAEYQ